MWPRWPSSPKTESGCEPWSCPCGVSQGWSPCSLSSGNADKRSAGGALRGRRVSRQVILSPPHQLSAVSVLSLTLLSLHTYLFFTHSSCFSCQPVLFSFRSERSEALDSALLLFFGVCWVIWSVSFIYGSWLLSKRRKDALIRFGKHETVTSDPLSLIDMAILISFY